MMIRADNRLYEQKKARRAM